MTIDLLEPADERAGFDTPEPATDELARPFRLGIVGVGVSVGLFSRLLVANGVGDLLSRSSALAAALTSAVVGLGLMLIAMERDRFGPPLFWITGLTAVGWGALNWISPPFADSVTVWNNAQQTVLAAVGVGNGLLLAGIITLALVRRAPTLTVAATLIAGTLTLTANTIALRDEWPAVALLGVAFALLLLAWDRSPRRERHFQPPSESPRISRAALSLATVAFCGTALQLWLSRDAIPRALPAIAVSVVVVCGAFASLVRVRREIERRETTLSEWRSWMREARTNDFRAEIQNFESTSGPEAPRPLSFPNLVIPAESEPERVVPPELPVAPGQMEEQIVGLTPDAVPTAETAPAPNLEPIEIELPIADIPDAAAAHSVPAAPDIAIPTADLAPSAAGLPLPDIAIPTADLAPDTPPAQDIAIPTADLAPETLPAQDIAIPTADLAPETPPAQDIAIPTADRAPSAAGLPVPDIAIPTADLAPRAAGLPLPVPDGPGERVQPSVPRVAIPTADPIPVAATATSAAAAAPQAATSVASGAFSSLLADTPPESEPDALVSGGQIITSIVELDRWLNDPVAPARPSPLLIAIETMPLSDYDALSDDDKEMAQEATGEVLLEAMPTVDVIALIDGPYFMVALSEMADRDVMALNKNVRRRFRETNGTLALIRPAPDLTLDGAVNEAVMGLVRARQIEEATLGSPHDR